MSIQASVNSAISSIGALTLIGGRMLSETPAAKTAAQIRAKDAEYKSEESKIKQRLDQIKEHEKDLPDKDMLAVMTPEQQKDFHNLRLDLFKRKSELMKSYGDIERKRFELNPKHNPYGDVMFSSEDKAPKEKTKPAFDGNQGDKAVERAVAEISAAMKVRNTMNRIRGLYDE